MMLPLTYRDDMTDTEVVQAYLADGCTPEEADALMNALRHPEPGMVYD